VTIAHHGKWADTYQPPARTWTLIHSGGPADGTRLPHTAAAPPQARWYAPAADRRQRAVRLARYTLHHAEAPGTVIYLHSGTDERRGPAAGRPGSPAWSW
jgi:hypothetical protein